MFAMDESSYSNNKLESVMIIYFSLTLVFPFQHAFRFGCEYHGCTWLYTKHVLFKNGESMTNLSFTIRVL